MIFPRMLMGLSLLATSVRYLMSNPALLLLPLIIWLTTIVIPLASIILLLELGVPIALDSFDAPAHSYSPSVLFLSGLSFYSSFFMYVYVIRRIMKSLTKYQPSLALDNVMPRRALLSFIVMASLIGIMSIPILVLQGAARVLFIVASMTLSLLLWPVVPLVLQGRYPLSKIVPLAVTIAQKTWPEALCGIIIFHLIDWVMFCMEIDGLINIIMLYPCGLNSVLQGIFIVILYRYFLDNNRIDNNCATGVFNKLS